MLPVFIIWLIRRYRRNLEKIRSASPGFQKFKSTLRSFLNVLLFSVAILAGPKTRSQNKTLNYEILRNGNKVGTLQFSETISSGMDYLKMISDVKTRFIFTFTAHASEEAVYYNGLLLRSSIYRLVNGNEKTNKQHQADNKQYIVRKGKTSDILKNFPITYNMLSLYSKEPEHVNTVYSDNFEAFIAIQKTEPHKYKITLPDGNYNYYRYKDGVLSEVDVHHSLYSANIVLTN